MSVRHQIPCYADGRTYLGLHTDHSGRARPYDCRRDQVISLTSPGLAWTRFWQIVSNELQRHDYSQSTIELYRSILRGFWRHSHTQPSATNERLIRDHLDRLVEEKYSWSWIGMNISVLRSVFDKLGGMSITTHCVQTS